MKRECLGEHIVSDTPHLHRIGREKLASVDEDRSHEGHWVVSLRHDEHPDDLFISIYDEVAAPLSHVFVFLDQFLFAEVVEVAEVGANHDWDLSKVDADPLLSQVIHFPHERGRKSSRVGNSSFSAFGRVDVGVVVVHELRALDSCS